MHPLVLIDHGGEVFLGRVKRSDSDPEDRPQLQHRYGIMVLEDPALGNYKERVVQIADLPCKAIREVWAA
jgi:hypothetical protein